MRRQTSGSLYWAVEWTVEWAVGEAVYLNVVRPVIWTVERGIRSSMTHSVARAVRNDPMHPALSDFLVSAGKEAPSNMAVFVSVEWTVFWALKRDVGVAVSWDVCGIVYSAMDDAVDRAAYWAVNEAMFWFVRRGPSHPALVDFLTSADQGGAMRSNEAAHEAMRDTGHLAVHWAAHRAVSGFVPWAMIWAMDMTVYGAASAAVDEVMHRAVRTDPSHPSRVAFLALVGGKDAA